SAELRRRDGGERGAHGAHRGGDVGDRTIPGRLRRGVLMLAIEHLTVRYGTAMALDGIDVTVDDRAIVSVLGPSGSGKSPLLRAVAGLVPEASGVVRWDGVDLRGVPPHRRGFGLMFQDHALFPHRDVIGNVSFGLRMQRRPREEIEARARETL